MKLNLARDPFVNLRPVRRTTVLLWVLGTILLGANVLLYWQHFTGQGESRQRQLEVDEATGEQSARIERLEEQLGKLDLEWQNEQVAFLNSKIAERTFPWSHLFDRIAEVLPANVRLTRMTPGGGRRRSSGVGRSTEPAMGGGVFLQIAGEARSGAALLAFVESLYEHPSFHAPKLLGETTGDDGVVDFALTAAYVPQRAERAPDPEAPAGGEPRSEESGEEVDDERGDERAESRPDPEEPA